MKKCITCLLLCLLLLFGLTIAAHAADVGDADAQALYELGLFRGVGTLENGSPDFALDDALTRQEAVVMLVRLLGEEQTALNGTWEMPFTDVADWAKPYVGYAYANGLTKGVSDAAFGGTQTVSATQYLTFALRALGYTSGEDFRWDAAWELTDTLGMTWSDYNADTNDWFLRGDAAFVSRRALQTACKDGSGTLLDALLAKGAVSEEAVDACSLLSDPTRAMVRALLAADCTPMSVTLDENGNINGRRMYAQDAVFQNRYDEYSEKAATSEDALTKAMKSYIGNCADGDYSAGINGYPTFSVGGSTEERNWRMNAVILTDMKGTIIAYGMICGETNPGDTITLYRCNFDSRPYIDPLVKEAKALIKKVKEISCTGLLVDGQYVYTVANLPENAVYYTLDSLGLSSGGPGIPQLVTRDSIIGAHLGAGSPYFMVQVDETFYLVADGIVEAAPEDIDPMWEYHTAALTLWDKNKHPIGFCFVVIAL